MDKPKNSHKTRFFELAEKAGRVIITSHGSPDPDAIGSCTSMYYWVKNNLPGKEVHIFYEDEKNLRFNYLTLAKNIEWVENLAEKIKSDDLLVFLDGTPLTRFTDHAEEIDINKYAVFCIDHHEPEENNYAHWISEPKTSSCCELISRYFYTDEELKDRTAAEALLTGILSDTYSFSFVGPESTSAFIEAKRIVDNSKIKVDNLVRKISTISPSKYELVKIFVANSQNVKLREDVPGLTYSFINRADAKGHDVNEVKEASLIFIGKFLRQVEGYSWGFTVIPADDEYKISFRSSTNAPNVQKLAKEHLNGGGHKGASGGSLPLSAAKDTKEAAETVLTIIKSAEIEIIPQE